MKVPKNRQELEDTARKRMPKPITPQVPALPGVTPLGFSPHSTGIEFAIVAAYGCAGGTSRGMSVTIEVEGKADTVESVRKLVAASPDLLEALHIAEQYLVNRVPQMPLRDNVLATISRAIAKAEYK